MASCCCSTTSAGTSSALKSRDYSLQHHEPCKTTVMAAMLESGGKVPDNQPLCLLSRYLWIRPQSKGTPSRAAQTGQKNKFLTAAALSRTATGTKEPLLTCVVRQA